jgi:hypothetical protein
MVTRRQVEGCGKSPKEVVLKVMDLMRQSLEGESADFLSDEANLEAIRQETRLLKDAQLRAR